MFQTFVETLRKVHVIILIKHQRDHSLWMDIETVTVLKLLRYDCKVILATQVKLQKICILGFQQRYHGSVWYRERGVNSLQNLKQLRSGVNKLTANPNDETFDQISQVSSRERLFVWLIIISRS